MDVHAGPLREQADRIRTSPLLGRSGLLRRLFDYLVECAQHDRVPREAEIAVDVFGRGGDFDSTQDAAIRVYMHRLRSRLEAYYAGPGRDEPARLVLRRGEYRLDVERLAADADDGDTERQDATFPIPAAAADIIIAAPSAPRRRPHRWRWALAATLLLSLAGNGHALWTHWSTPDSPGATALRRDPLWAGLLDDERPILLVLGDYYIFGDTGAANGGAADAEAVRQLVRDFQINSAADLHDLLARRPELGERYLNLGLSYLPTSSAFALRELMPVLAAPGRKVEVVMASDLRLDMLKQAHVVYVGFLSGLGPLRDFTFAGSRYAIGGSYDELVDLHEHRRYVSQAGTTLQGDAMYSDYGYVAGFPGPNGNRILIVAGTRDVAVMHAAEVLADPAALRELERPLAGHASFEALYEVNGINHASIRGRLLHASPRSTVDVWQPATLVAQHSPR